jgi:N-formylglutamate amidohydrolase
LPDTDWFVPRLYDVPELKSASIISANVSRYVVDLNRPPTDENLYPGQNTTKLCPETNFDGSPIYKDGQPIAADEIQRRVNEYWRPYHEKLRQVIQERRSHFGFAVLLDLHSIASRVPNLFQGVLPDLNFGTNHGQSAGASFQKVVEQIAHGQREYSAVVNGRFVGGYITRNYGNPERQVHAVQLELSQATYMDESRAAWDQAKALRIQTVLRGVLRDILRWVNSEANRVQS